MTSISLQELKDFLKKYSDQIKLPIGNYGGGFLDEEEDRVKNLFTLMGITEGYDVLDYDTGVDLMKPINKKYNLGICMDLLEHTINPFIIAANISSSLEKEALLFVTAPWVWEVHEYPIDNWRFTISGLATLFPEMKLIEARYVRDKHIDEEPEPLPRERVVAIFQKE